MFDSFVYSFSYSNLFYNSIKPNQNETTASNYARTYSYVLTPGSLDEGVSTKITNNPAEYEPQANMRYAMLHSQIVEITIPCNIRLTVGTVIKLLIENIYLLTCLKLLE